MRALLDRLLDTSHYPTALDKERARVIFGISILLALLTVIFLTAVVPTWFEVYSPFTPYIFAFGIVNLVNIVMVRLGYLNVGAVILVLSWYLITNISTAVNGAFAIHIGILLVTTIALSGLLLPRYGIIIGVVLAVSAYLVNVNVRIGTPLPEPIAVPAEVFTTLAAFLVFTGLIYVYVRFTQLNREEGANAALQDRLRLSEITTQITQRISSRTNLSEVLNGTVDLIVEGYPDVYHAQIFLVDDDGRKARLAASTGEVGRTLLARQHSLDVGSSSVIGRVSADGKAVIARARALDTVHRRNELLPDTLVEAAFPLRSGDTVIGALDLQSKQSIAFLDRDLPIFQTLADHIAVSIDNARLFEQTEQRVEENRRLVDQSRNTLREVERLNMRLTGRAWTEYLRTQRGAEGLLIDFTDNIAEEGVEWTPGLQEAVQNNDVIEQIQRGQRVIAAPLRVRGQVIGAMEFELDANGEISPEDLELVQEVSERFGLAVENARLYDQSQRSAQREALINEIGARLQQTNNIETTLSQAAQSLKQALKADKVSIRLGPPPGENGSNGGGA